VSTDDLLKAIVEEPVIQEISRRTFTGKVYLVGGAIREISLNKTPRDYDFALTRSQDLCIFENIFGSHSFLLGKKPTQTYRIVSQEISLDLGFLDGPIENDLARRDFTMNALAFDVIEHKLIDSLKGLDDINAKIVRCANNQNLVEDPLRLLKAVRHFTTLYGFTVDQKLVDAIQSLKHHIHEVAPERIKYEMDQIVVSDRSFEGLRMLQEAGLLFELFPDLLALQRLDEEKHFVLETFGHTIDGFKYLPSYGKEYLLDERGFRNVAYALLFHDLGKAHTFSYDNVKMAVHFFHHEKISCNLATLAMEKLRFSSLDIKTVVKLIANHMRIFLISNSLATDKAIRRLVYKIGDLTPALIVLTLCDMYGSSGGTENDSTITVKKRCIDILRAFNEWKQKPLPRLITGHDLLALGFEQGPQIGKTLDDIRERQIGGELTERAEALRYAMNFINRDE
jgi:tRNA nucleotidyltransferase/poly(A) polymerase